MGCKECGKPKCNGECGCKSPKVLQINNPAEYITFHKVSIPAAMGDSTTNPPKIGAYRNALVYYEADHTSWMYSTDGIPTLVTGEKGETGDVGPQGPAGTITVGTTTTGEAGSDAEVENVGTSENAILNFTIPKGDKGDQGVPGPQGYMNEQDVRNVVDTIVPEGFFSEPATETDCGSPIIAGNEEPKEIANIVLKNETNATIYGEHEIVRCGKNLLSNKIAGSISWSGSVVTFSGSEIKVSKTGNGGISANPQASTVYYPIKQGDKLTFTMKYREGTINSDGSYSWVFYIYGVRADGTADSNSRLIIVSIPYNTTTPSAVSVTGTSNSDYIGFRLGTYIAGNTPTTSGDVYFDCQLETGETATAIEPYSEIRYPLSLFNSKNLIDPTPLGSGTLNGLDYSVSSDGTINISGTASANTHLAFPITIPSYCVGENAVFSYTGTFSTIGDISIKRRIDAAYWGGLTSSTTYSSREITEARYNNADTVDIYIPNGRVVSAAIKLQFEIGDSATEYEQFSPINLDAGDRFEKINNVWNIYDSSDDSYSRVTNARLISQLYALDGLNYSNGYNTIFDSTQYGPISPCISYYGDGYYATIAQLESADSDRVYRSPSVSVMANTDIPENSLVETAGCMIPGDGGNALYIIQSTNETADGYAIVDMQNGMQARLLPQNGKVNIRQFGAAGDGATDDTAAINNAIAYCQQADIHELVVPDGVFVISDSITVTNSVLKISGTIGSSIKYVGMGSSGNFFNIYGTEADPISNIIIEGINLNGTSQIYKGGHSLSDPATTDPDPIARGLKCFEIKFVTNAIVRNCKANDVYGEGIRVQRCHTVIVDGNVLTDVGGGNIIIGGQTGYDNFGDGIVAFECFDTKIINNTVINTRTYLSATANGYICGRSGLEFEYGLQTDGINTPGQELFVEKSGQGLVMDNNYVYGYTKGIHLEAGVKCIITNNTVVHNNIGLMNTISGKTVIANNYFNQDEVGKAYQSGYDGYYGGVAISQYTNQNPAAANVEVNGNIFDGDTTGVHIGRSYVSVNNNTFRGNGNTWGAIHTIISGLYAISINGNQFYDCYVRPYHARGINISNNVFNNATSKCLYIEGGRNISITGNYIDNEVYATGYPTNLDMSANNFYVRSDYSGPLNPVHFAQNTRNASFMNNNIDLLDNDSVIFANFVGAINLRVSENSIYLNPARTENVFFFSDGLIDATIQSNMFRGCGYKSVLMRANWTTKRVTFTDNILDEPTALLYRGYGWLGQCRIERNVGNMNFTSNTKINSAATLADNYIQQGDIISQYVYENSTAALYCSQGGYYVTTQWTNGDTYAVNKLVELNGYVYKCLTAGTATVAPANTTIGDDETGADGVKWVCVSKLAILRNITIA